MLINFDSLQGFWNGLKVYISSKIKSSKGDWNQNNPEADNYIKNRPFYETKGIAPLDIMFNGSLAGRDHVMAEEGVYLVKLSDIAPTIEELNQGYATASEYTGEQMISVTENLSDFNITEEITPSGQTVIMVDEFGFVLPEDWTEPSLGISLTKGMWAMTVPGYFYLSRLYLPAVYQEIAKKLDNKFIDAEWMAKSNGDEQSVMLYSSGLMSSYQVFELDNIWTPTMLPIIVTFNGMNYTYNRAMLLGDGDGGATYAVGNFSIIDGGAVNTGEPFALGLVSNTTIATIISNIDIMSLSISIGSSCEPLPEKFLPSSVVKRAELATVAMSGSYNDLTDKPQINGGVDTSALATVATSGSYNDLKDKPSLATVATSGDYNDLINKPTQSDSGNQNEKYIILKDVDTSTCYYVFIKNGTLATSVDFPVNNIEDFTYTDNGDGTKTLTGWNGTFLGDPSTEIIIPNDESIIV